MRVVVKQVLLRILKQINDVTGNNRTMENHMQKVSASIQNSTVL